MTILAIYAAGAVFFLTQAALYDRISFARVYGAIVWPLALVHLPRLIISTAAAYRHVGPGHSLQGIAWGRTPNGDRLWGIGA